MREKALLLRVLPLALLLLGCGDGDTPYPTSQPSSQAVSGRYVLAGDEEVIAKFGANGVLELRADGTFAMQRMPGWGYSGEFAAGKIWAGQGNWELRTVPVRSRPRGWTPHIVSLHFSTIGGRDVHYNVHTPGLWGSSYPWEIRISIGDPDSQRMLILQKEEEKRGEGTSDGKDGKGRRKGTDTETLR